MKKPITCILALCLLVIGYVFAEGHLITGIDLDGVRIDNYSEHLDPSLPGTVERIAIPNAETAVKVADAITAGMIDFEPEISVCFDEENGIWIVNYAETEIIDGVPIIVCGGDLSIALQASDSRVVRIWFGE